MMRLYAMSVSGNCWKAAWMLRLCRVPFEVVETSYDGANGTLKTRSPEFLAKNPNGQTPLLELSLSDDNGGGSATANNNSSYIAESNAILLYLAERYGKCMPPATPGNHYDRAMVYQWLFFEQYSHEPSIAVRRANIIFQRNASPETMQALLDKGHHALQVMNDQLVKSRFIAGTETITVADIALFAYTHMAHEGGFELHRFPAVQAWLQRIQAMPEFQGMEILREPKFVPSA